MRNWFCSSSPTQRRRRLPRWSISSFTEMPAGQAVHVVDGAEDIVDDDVLGHQIVLMELDLLLQLLAGVLAQQLLQHVEADTLLDAALSQGIEVHIVAQVAHLVGLHPQRLTVHQR